MTERGLFHPGVGVGTPLFVARTGTYCLADLGAEISRLESALARTTRNELVLVSGSRAEVLAALGAAMLTKGTVLLAARLDLLGADAAEGRLIVTGGETPSRRGVADASARAAAQRLVSARVPNEHPLVCMVTSGSTGVPVVHRKLARQLLGEAQVLARAFDLTSGSVVLSTVSAGHLYGALFGLLAPLQGGASVVVDADSEPQVFHPERVAELGQSLGATHLVTLPAHVTTLVSAVARFEIPAVISSAARLEPELARALEARGAGQVIDVLGSTETGGIATRRPSVSDAWAPLPGVELRFTDDERLAVRAPWSAAPAEFEMLPERAVERSPGTFCYLGRDDGIVKVGGRRVALAELERAALSIPGVTDAVAVAVPTRDARENLLALVVAGAALERGELRARLGERLSREAMPRRLCLVRSLPRDERGKLPRARLLALLDAQGGLQRVAQGGTANERWVEVSLPAEAPRFDGHFPGAPILPAVSQLLDVAVPEARELASMVLGGTPQLARLSRFKWQAAFVPGDRMRVTVTAANVTTPQLKIAVLIERKHGEAWLRAASGSFEFVPRSF